MALLGGLKKPVMVRAWLLIYIARVHGGLPAVITSALRTQAQQEALYAQGRTTPGAIVTWTLRSKHLTGHAFDIDMLGHTPASVPREVWDWCGRVGEALGLAWGGRWSVADLRHFEM